MLDLNQTLTFVEVVRAAGFAAAARRLSLPRSTVSARIQALEERLGVKLLKRSTRRVSLTEEGKHYFESVAAAIDTLQEAEAASSAERGVLAGKIRFTAPSEFPHETLSTMISTFLARHPRIRIEVVLSNRLLDFVTDHIDLALRAGSPTGAGQIVRKTVDFSVGLFASPSYLERHGAPATREELRGHALLWYVGDPGGRASSNEQSIFAAIPPGEPKVTSDSMALLKTLALQGAGIAFLPEFICTREVAAGSLVKIIDLGRGASPSLYIVFPSRRDVTPRVRAFAEHLRDLLQAGARQRGRAVERHYDPQRAGFGSGGRG